MLTQARGPRVFHSQNSLRLEKSNLSSTTASFISSSQPQKNISTETLFVCSDCKKSKIPVRSFFHIKIESIVYIWAEFDSIQGHETIKNLRLIHRFIKEIHYKDKNTNLPEENPYKHCTHFVKDAILRGETTKIISFGEEVIPLFYKDIDTTECIGKEMLLDDLYILCTAHPTAIRNGGEQLIQKILEKYFKKGNFI